MSIKIKTADQVSTILETSSTLEVGEHLPRVLVDVNDWDFLSKPRWEINKSVQREGNYQYYNGSDDRVGRFTLHLSGATKNTNLETLRALQDPIYLDATDIDSNDSGLYTLSIITIKRNIIANLITLQIQLEAYNN